MKRALTLFLGLLALFTLCACGSKKALVEEKACIEPYVVTANGKSMSIVPYEPSPMRMVNNYTQTRNVDKFGATEISFDKPIPLYDDDRVGVTLTRIHEETVFGQKPNKCIEFKIKNKLDTPIRLWSMTMYLDGEEMHSVHRQNIKEIYDGKSAIRAFNVEYGDRTPLNSLDELLIGECILDIEIRSKDGSTIVDEFVISFDYDLTEQQ